MQIKRVEEVDRKPDLSAVELNLPSRCVDYPAPAQGPFQLRPPRVKEVEFLAGMSTSNYDEQLSKLLRSLIVSPVLLDPMDLTIGDRQYLHVWVRAQIDPLYYFEATCPKCGYVDPNYRLEIAKIPLIELPQEYSPNMRLQLPRSKHVVTVRLETARDRLRAEQLEAKGFTTWVSRKALVITTVDEKPVADEARCVWLRELPAGDDMFLGEYLRWQTHGPDLGNCPFTCRKCAKESALRLPFRLEFYLPSVHAAAAFGDAVRGGGLSADGGLSGDARDRGDGVREVRVGSGQDEGAPRAGQAAGQQGR